MWPWRQSPHDPLEQPASRDDPPDEAELFARWGRQWLCAALIMAGFAILPWVGIFRLTSGASIRVHIVEVDPQGKILWLGETGSYTYKDIYTDMQVREWITWTRRRSDDATIDHAYRQRAMEMTTGQATELLEQYYARLVALEAEERPHSRMRVSVEIRTMYRESSTSYRVRWQERWTPTVGTQVHLLELEGSFRVEERLKPTGVLAAVNMTADDFQRSPLGVFITYFDWGEVLPATPTSVATPPSFGRLP